MNDAATPVPSERGNNPNGRESTSDKLVVLLAIVAFAILTMLTLRYVSPYIDTAWQIGISREPTFSAFVDRAAGDNQAPMAQLIFWVGAQLGLETVTEQRALSLFLATACYITAIWGGCTIGTNSRGDGARFGPKSALVTAGALTVIAAGVYPISGFVRYSTFVGPIWIFVYMLVERFRSGESHLSSSIGLTVGLAFFISYTALILAVAVFIAVLSTSGGRKWPPIKAMVLGFMVGLLPVVIWIAFAGPEHIRRILHRTDVTQADQTLRALAGKTYELLAWMFTGPASLPSLEGLLLLFLIGFASLALVERAVRKGVARRSTVLMFTAMIIPLLIATRINIGWSMVGPAATVAFVAGLGVGSIRWCSRTVAAVAILVTATVSALPVANMLILRPVSFASRAVLASDLAIADSGGLQSLIVCGDWALCLLLDGTTTPQSKRVRSLAQFAEISDQSLPSKLTFVLQDYGREPFAQQSALNRIDKLGYVPVKKHIVAPYDSMSLRTRLGLIARSGQYSVEIWMKTDVQ